MQDRSSLRALARDALGLAGVGAITFGVALIYRPAGLVVIGLFALAAAVRLSRTGP